MKILIAGFGNPLMGDDGFGVAVVSALKNKITDPCVVIKEIGNSGIEFVHELLNGYDAVIVIDAISKGEPGYVYILEPDIDVLERDPQLISIDAHSITPIKAMLIAKKLGCLPRIAYIVGTKAINIDETPYELTEPVYRAVNKAVEVVISLIDKFREDRGCEDRG